MGKVKSVIQSSKPEARIIGRKALKESIACFLGYSYQKEEFSTLIDAINSANLTYQHFGIIGLRKLISNGNSRYPPNSLYC